MASQPSIRGGRRLPSRLLVPVRCGGCGDALAASETSWCVHCSDRWGPPPGAWAAGLLECPGWAAADYRGPVRRAILMAKRGAPAAAIELLLLRWPAGALPAGATVTWVPAHPWRALRAPDAGRALAQAIARRDGLQLAPLLRRSPAGRRQAHLADHERRRDPARLGLSARAEARGPVVMIDDVRTTGTTLDHAAQLLRAAGAGPVSALVVAGAAGH